MDEKQTEYCYVDTTLLQFAETALKLFKKEYDPADIFYTARDILQKIEQINKNSSIPNVEFNEEGLRIKKEWLDYFTGWKKYSPKKRLEHTRSSIYTLGRGEKNDNARQKRLQTKIDKRRTGISCKELSQTSTELCIQKTE